MFYLIILVSPFPPHRLIIELGRLGGLRRGALFIFLLNDSAKKRADFR